MAIPLRTFNGFLKQHTPPDRNEQGDFIFERAFPSFGPTQKQTKSDPIDRAVQDVVGQLQTEGKHIELLDVSSDRPGRRFSGDLGRHQFLSRGRYSTVCLDNMGADGGTLQNELEAYVNPNVSGYVRVVDLGQPNPLVPTSVPKLTSAIAIYLEDLPFLRSSLKADFLARFAPGRVENSLLMIVPYRVRSEKISRVLDLRFADSREWIAKTFAKGCKGYLEYSGPPVSKKFGFFDFWATLCRTATGGTHVDDCIGRYLQDAGVNGLIFPSARSDVSAVFDRGRLVAWKGWNFVDYRGLERGVRWPYHHLTGWMSKLQGGRRFVAATKGRNKGSFRVERCEYSHRAAAHFLLLFSHAREWCEKDNDNWVNRYVWFKSALNSNGLTCRCQQCDALVEFPGADLENIFLAPDKCGACGNETNPI